MAKEDSLKAIYGRIKGLLEENCLTASDLKVLDYGIQFKVSSSQWSDLIRIYQNKKGVLKFDYSQVKNRGAVPLIQKLIESDQIVPYSYEFNANEKELGFPIIGTDESGKGDYFGPLVTAGVWVDEQLAAHLKSIGVRDSKEINDADILKLAKKIVEICPEEHSIIEISPEKYNELYEQFQREHKNLNTLLAWGHAKAIEELLFRVPCKKALADQFADERYILSKLQERGKRIELVQMPKAEQNIAVAAASILARARYLERLARLSRIYKIDLPKGASSAVIGAAQRFVGLYGQDSLHKVAKLHFKTTERILRAGEGAHD